MAEAKDYMPEDNHEYSKKTYWQARFSEEDKYDWLAEYEAVKHLLGREIKKEDRILCVGCGNSTLSESLYNDGYKNITNIDFAESVIERMSAKHADKPEMKWQVMDMLNIQFPDASFDVVLDKAAMDAIMVDEEDPWDPAEKVLKAAASMCAGVSRVLTPEGKFLQISFQQPHFRRPYVDKPEYGWGFKREQFGDGFGYFFYTMAKGQRQD